MYVSGLAVLDFGVLRAARGNPNSQHQQHKQEDIHKDSQVVIAFPFSIPILPVNRKYYNNNTIKK
jgi:hypothetical protein